MSDADDHCWAAITYRGYWDVPRIILVRRDGQVFLLDGQFDDRLDDYPDEYTAFLMPPDWDDGSAPQDWRTLRQLATLRLGTIPVAAVRFDHHARPQQINASVLDGFAAAARPPG